MAVVRPRHDTPVTLPGIIAKKDHYYKISPFVLVKSHTTTNGKNSSTAHLSCKFKLKTQKDINMYGYYTYDIHYST